MPQKQNVARVGKPSEEGYMLVAVIFLLALLVLSMAVAIPKVREDIERDREVETMHRGKQYARAIKLYYKKFNAYPPNVEALVMTNNIRFLRKRYVDPITGKDDWRPIHFGENKTPVAMGFFGQPLAGVGSTLAGTGPGGIPGASPIGTGMGGTMTGSAFGGTGSAFGGTGSSFGGTGSSFGGTGSGSTNSGSIFGSNTTDNSGNGATTNGSSDGSGGQSSGGSGTAGTSGSGSSTPLSTNQTFGGGGIIGFAPGSDKQSILIYKKMNHFNQWEFLYSPLADQLQGGNLGGIGQPIGTPTGIGGGLSGGPQQGGGLTFPGGAGSTAPTQPTAPTPQQ